MSSDTLPNTQERIDLRPLYFLFFFTYTFQLVGLTGPGWIITSAGGKYSRLGILFGIVCTKSDCQIMCSKDNCHIASMIFNNKRPSTAGKYVALPCNSLAAT